MANTSITVGYPREEPNRPTHSQDWFDTHPEPGHTRQDWITHLCISARVGKGLVEQVRAGLQREKLHMTGQNASDIADEIDEKIGMPLAEERSDIYRGFIPLDHFLLTIQRMADRINRGDLNRKQKVVQTEAAKQPGAKRGPKRRRVVDPASSDSESGKEFESIFVQDTSVPRSRPSEVKRPRLDTPPSSDRDGNISPIAPRLQDTFQPKPKPENIWLQITNPEDELSVFYEQLSKLADEELDMDNYSNVQLDKLWELIKEKERYADWPFFDRKKQYLSGIIDGKKRNVMAPASFIFACQSQLAALQEDPTNRVILEFEILLRPDWLKCQSPPSPAQPTFPPRHLPMPSTWPLSPAPVANMMPPTMTPRYRPAEVEDGYEAENTHTSHPDVIRLDTCRPMARMYESRPASQDSVPISSVVDVSRESARRFPELPVFSPANLPRNDHRAAVSA